LAGRVRAAGLAGRAPAEASALRGQAAALAARSIRTMFHQDRRAILAIEMFAHRVKKYVGAYMAEMGGTDAICFAGGIGENSPTIRKRILSGFDWFGVKLDEEKNKKAIRGKEMAITTPDSQLPVYVIPTNEELILARDTVRAVKALPFPC
jgi:acetate kinase